MANNLLEQDIQAIIQAGGTDKDVENYLKESRISYSISGEVKAKPKDQFLPGRERVEELRGKRPAITTESFERFASPKRLSELFYNPMARVPELVLGAGETARTIESGLASAGLKAQEGARPRDIISAFYGRDVTQRPAEFGDIPRRAGVPEPLSKAIGLGTAMAIPDIATLGQFGRGVAKTTRQVSEELQDTMNTLKTKLPQKMGDEWLIAQAQKTYSVADDTVKAMNKEIDDFYKATGDIPIEPGRLKKIIADLFAKTTDEAEKLEVENMLKNIRSILPVEFKPNVYAAKVVKDAIQEFIPESAWLKGRKGMSLTPVQAKRVKAYFNLKGLIEENLSGEDLEYFNYLNKKATDVYRTSNTIKKMVIGPTGEATETGRLISTFGGKPQQAGKRLLFKRLSELNEHTQEIMKNMDKFRKRQILKTFGKRAGYGALGTYVGYRLLDKLFGGNR